MILVFLTLLGVTVAFAFLVKLVQDYHLLFTATPRLAGALLLLSVAVLWFVNDDVLIGLLTALISFGAFYKAAKIRLQK